MTDESRDVSEIRVIHLLHTMDYGGVETIIVNWLRTLQPERVNVSIVCFANPGGTEQLFVDAAVRAGFDVQTIPWSRRKPILSSATQLAEILKKHRAQIVHTHNTYADLVGLVAARRLGIRTVSSLYVWSGFGWKRRALEWISLQALRDVDCVTAQCEATRRDTCARGIAPEKVHVLHSGYEAAEKALDESERATQRAAHGIEPNHVLMVNVARLYPEKAQARLLKEFQRTNELYPDTRLWILGRGPLEEELQELCTELGLDHAVRFIGYVPNFHELTRLADIQLHPSYTEGIPMAILSGMSVGLPIIASSVGGIAEVIADGERGILVPAADAPDFSDAYQRAVSTLVERLDDRKRLGDNARHFIENEYSLENAAVTLERLYRDVLAL